MVAAPPPLPKGKHVTGFSVVCDSLQHGYHRLTGVTPVPLPPQRSWGHYGCKLDGKKISKKAASEKFGKDEMDRMIREAKKAFAEDPLEETSWWMGEGMLSITFR